MPRGIADLFNKLSCVNSISKWEKLKLPHIYIKINSWWIVGVNMRSKAINFPKDNIGGNHCDLGKGKDFLH